MIYDKPTYRRSGSTIVDAYTTRLFIGLIASLASVVILLNLPVRSPSPEIEWHPQRPAERILAQEIQSDDPRSETAKNPEEAPPPTHHDSHPTESSRAASSEGSSGDESSKQQADGDTTTSVIKLARLSATDDYPTIVGGTGALYLNIDYPPEAIRQKIEGRLKLTFTVGKNGNVRRIQVTESLHPLCDSAAVEGLRSVQFRPATREGEPVPVRMSLPIRFRLKSNTDLPLQTTRGTPSGE